MGVNSVAYGGGGLFGPHYQIVRCHSETLSAGVAKLCDLMFLAFGHIMTTN